MKRIAQFEKVSRERFFADWQDCFGDQKNTAEETAGAMDASEAYDGLRLPRRATSGSAGYDFFLPCALVLAPGETIKIPTGIRVRMDEGWVCKLYPRSGLGFKFRLQLNNTVGIIDSDYYGSDNEGHILARITNDSNENRTVDLEPGDAFMQGVFVEYGITFDDDASEVRNGGLGSTSK